nr:nucleoside triphosphate pyrophosphohydrolase family protein [Aliamphritea spongicola]
MSEVRDAIADVLVTTYGMAHVLGIDADQDMATVQASNLSKLCKTQEEVEQTLAYYSEKLACRYTAAANCRKPLSNQRKIRPVKTVSSTRRTNSLNALTGTSRNSFKYCLICRTAPTVRLLYSLFLYSAVTGYRFSQHIQPWGNAQSRLIRCHYQSVLHSEITVSGCQAHHVPALQNGT